LANARAQAEASVDELSAQRQELENVIAQYRVKVRQVMGEQLDAMERILGDLGA
jgi:Spy/CpxP family protein refolding chaperone